MKSKEDLIIIGAGLSGLYVANLLQDDFNITILEARKRTGGRIFTDSGHDMGPSWIWPHQHNILTLLKELGLETFSQYTKGDALYDSTSGVQRFCAPPSAPSSRVKGGLTKLIQALESTLDIQCIHKNEEVLSITQKDTKLMLQTTTKQYEASYVLSTLSPRLACEHITYTPPLNPSSKDKMLQTPTWMGHTAKCVIEFESNFWRDEGLSGFIYSPVGPLGEIHDASTHNQAALFGFVHSNAPLSNIKEAVKQQIKRLFPDKANLISNIYLVDWRQERFSSTSHDSKGPSTHPEYGLSLSHFNEKMYFMGTETAYDNGGYLEGAIISAQEIATKLSCK